jgi:cold shock CspA family protein
MENEMNQGIGMIVMYNAARYFGFIQEAGGPERFFHATNVAPGFVPELGAMVQYEIAAPIRIGKAPQAVNVRRAGGAL